MDNFRFNIEKSTESVWTFIFENEDKTVRVRASDFLDPIGSLFFELRLIIKAKNQGEVSMINEPEENIWTLNYIKSIIEIEIWNFEDYSGSKRNLTKGGKIFSGKMNFNRFLNQLVNSLHPFKSSKHISDLVDELVELRKKNYLQHRV